MSVLFEAQNLRKRYGAATVVDGVSFTIAPGECRGLLVFSAISDGTKS